MAYDYLLEEYTHDHTTCTVTINKAAVSNCIDKKTMDELQTCLQSLNQEESVRVIIITGVGTKVFCAGADISQMQSMDSAKAYSFVVAGQKALRGITEMSKPVIAAVNGIAVGGGCELALACDFIVAAEHAKIGSPEINLGIITGWCGSARLVSRIGLAKTRELLYTGEVIDAKTAHALGLFDKVFPATTFKDDVLNFAQTLAAKPAIALQSYKTLLRNATQEYEKKAEAVEADLFARCFDTHDQKEGMRAFLEKRKPHFIGK